MVGSRRSLLAAVLFVLLASFLPSAARAEEPFAPPVEQGVQAFLDEQPGALKTYRDGEQSAAELMEGVSAYYGVSPRILLALLEATSRLLSDPAPPEAALRQPFSPLGPGGFGTQVDWAARELRAGLGPYERPPTVTFSDGLTLTLTLDQAPEGVAVQRFLAKGRSAAEWTTTYGRFLEAFQTYFNNELPDPRPVEPAAINGFLQRPWAAGTRVVHLAYFDHMYPTVDTNNADNGFVVNYLGRGGMQYDGHDGHDFYFPDQPIGTYILAAADGIAYARTHRGNGVVVLHPDGYETVYWHLDKFAGVFRGKVDSDQGVPVRAGDLLGTSGKTGFVIGTPHLHFEVRHHGRQVDPYGWFGAGVDPCAAYRACETSQWLWHASLIGEGDFTPPSVAPPDHTPPVAMLTAQPRSDVLFLAHFDGTLLQQVGTGTLLATGEPSYDQGRVGQGVRVRGDDQLALPIAGNLRLDAGTLAFWANLPDTYPATKSGRNYLLAASANPDNGPVYTGTLALRREPGLDGAAQWNFWTTPDSGDSGRNDLLTPDTLAAGQHHFALTWDRAARTKALYIDGALAAGIDNVDLPGNVGAALNLGNFMPGAHPSGAVFDELVVFDRALPPTEIALLTTAQEAFQPAQSPVRSPNVLLDLNAVDDAGGIMSVQLGVDGVFGDPEPYAEQYHVRVPDVSGTHTIEVRLFDRAGNSATVSTTLTLDTASQVFLPMMVD